MDGTAQKGVGICILSEACIIGLCKRSVVLLAYPGLGLDGVLYYSPLNTWKLWEAIDLTQNGDDTKASN